MVSCEIYTSSKKLIWDDFVETCKTPLFFFKRDYLEYHADRFTDFSLMFYEDNQLVAIFPACKQGDCLNSHGGLTYGGLLLGNKTRSALTLTIVSCLISYARELMFRTILYKAIPYFLANVPAQEDLYAITQIAGASIYRRDLSSIIFLNNRLKLSKGKSWLIARGKKAGLSVTTSDDWTAFHQLLTNVLIAHQAKPVHSISELEQLASVFPDNFQLKVVVVDNVILAAALLFKFKTTVHTQYLATNEQGKLIGALDFLIETCIEESRLNGFHYFSFGISTEEQGKLLNSGLIAQKENFGARGVIIDFYEITIND